MRRRTSGEELKLRALVLESEPGGAISPLSASELRVLATFMERQAQQKPTVTVSVFTALRIADALRGLAETGR